MFFSFAVACDATSVVAAYVTAAFATIADVADVVAIFVVAAFVVAIAYATVVAEAASVVTGASCCSHSV